MTRPPLLQIGSMPAAMAERLGARFEILALAEAEDPEGLLAERGGEIEIAETDGHAGVPERVLAACPRLAMVASYGVGYDAIDADDLARRGIVVTHTPTVLDDEVADTALMLWLAAAKDLIPAHAHVASGAWEREGNMPLARGIRGRRVAILGLGRIGTAIARHAEHFGCEVLYGARSEKPVPWRYVADPVELARAAEVLFVITPLTEATHHLVGREMLDALGPEGILVNVARGPVVDEAELIAALREGRLGKAALDVFEAEPHVPQALREMPNVVLAPHIGSATKETRAAMGALVCRNIESFARDGTVLTPVPECRGIARLSDEPVLPD